MYLAERPRSEAALGTEAELRPPGSGFFPSSRGEENAGLSRFIRGAGALGAE